VHGVNEGRNTHNSAPDLRTPSPNIQALSSPSYSQPSHQTISVLSVCYDREEPKLLTAMRARGGGVGEEDRRPTSVPTAVFIVSWILAQLVKTRKCRGSLDIPGYTVHNFKRTGWSHRRVSMSNEPNSVHAYQSFHLRQEQAQISETLCSVQNISR